MIWLDWAILGVVALSTLISLVRGFVKEALSLLGWVAAFLIATALADRLSVLLSDHISNDALRYASAYVILFAATLMLSSLVNTLLGHFIRATGLSGADRVLGTVFGSARGLVLVLVAVYVMESLLSEEEQEFLSRSRLLPHVMMVGDWARESIAGRDIEGVVPWAPSGALSKEKE